jgi:Tol biopolymer transport system component/DNA-binding winged helix-turn-helix (wHTH) protein
MTAPPGDSRLRFGEFTLDVRTGELFSSGPTVTLSHQPLQLLSTLIAGRGELVTRDELRHQLWPGDTFVDFEPSLNAAIRRLREALGDSAETPRFIETLPRRGYRFMAPVDETGQLDADGGVGPVAALPIADPPSVGGLAAPPSRIRHLVKPALMVAGLAAVGGTLVFLFTGRPAPPLDRGTMSERLTNLGTVRLASLAPDGRRLAYVRVDGTRESLWVRQSAEPRDQVLLPPVDGTFRSVTFGPDEHVYYTLFMPDRTHISLYRVPQSGGAAQMVAPAKGRVAFSRDGTRSASVYTASLGRSESHVLVDDLATGTGRVVAVLQPPAHFLNLKPAWAPDGTRLAVAAVDESGQLLTIIIDVASAAERARHPLMLTQIAELLWVSDDLLVVAARERRGAPQRLWRLPLSTARPQPLTDALADYDLAGALAGSDTLVAVRRQRVRSLWLSVGAVARQVAVDSGSSEGPDGLAFTPDGRIVYEATDAGNVDIYVVNPADGLRRRVTTDAAADFHPAVSPDGTLIAFVSEREGTRGLWAMAADGTGARRLTADADDWPSFSHDSRWVAFQRGQHDNMPPTLWRVSLETREATRIGPTEAIRPAVSPDGRAVAHYWMTAEHWSVAVTPVDAKLPTFTLPLSSTQAGRTLRWSRDGRALAFLDTAGGASNVWLQSIDGGPPRALTQLAEGRLAAFDWSRDETALVWTRITEVGDVVTVAPLAISPGP